MMRAQGFGDHFQSDPTASSKPEVVQSEYRLVVRRAKTLVVGGLAAGCLVVLLVAALLGIRIYRIETTRSALIRFGAEYKWQHERIDPALPKSTRTRRLMARWLGNPTVSGFSLVRIDRGNLSDRELSFLSSLREVEILELHSDEATDQTLGVISRLPNLRYLNLAGKKFSVMGLLQLRRARRLRQLQFDAIELSPIELAVLIAELPGVIVARRGVGSSDAYRTVTVQEPPV